MFFKNSGSKKLKQARLPIPPRGHNDQRPFLMRAIARTGGSNHFNFTHLPVWADSSTAARTR
jgi:hypothetical protein